MPKIVSYSQEALQLAKGVDTARAVLDDEVATVKILKLEQVFNKSTYTPTLKPAI